MCVSTTFSRCHGRAWHKALVASACVLAFHARRGNMQGEADGRDRFEARGWRGYSSHSIIEWYISQLDSD